MDGDDALYLVFGLWALLMVAILISAIRLSYRVEKRSEALRNTTGIPRNTMILHTALNWRVARDHDTQALRRAMNLRLLAVAAGMALIVLCIRLASEGG